MEENWKNWPALNQNLTPHGIVKKQKTETGEKNVNTKSQDQ